MRDRIGKERDWPPMRRNEFVAEAEHGSLYVGAPRDRRPQDRGDREGTRHGPLPAEILSWPAAPRETDEEHRALWPQGGADGARHARRLIGESEATKDKPRRFGAGGSVRSQSDQPVLPVALSAEQHGVGVLVLQLVDRGRLANRRAAGESDGTSKALVQTGIGELGREGEVLDRGLLGLGTELRDAVVGIARGQAEPAPKKLLSEPPTPLPARPQM